MAGVSETLGDRKAYFQKLREDDPQMYLKKMENSTSRLARQLNAGNNRTTGQILGQQKYQNKQTDRFNKEQAAQENKRHFENKSQVNAQTASAKANTYVLSTDIRSLKDTLAGYMKDQVGLLKKMNMHMAAQGGLFGTGMDIFDLLDRKRGGRRGRRGGRRGGRRARIGGARSARRPPPLPKSGARPPPLPKGAGGSTLGRVAGAAKETAGTVLQRGGQAAKGALGWAKNIGGRAMGAIGVGGGAAEAGAGRALAGTALRRAGAVGAVVGGGLTAYQALKDDTKTDGEKAQAVANVAGGTAGALALGSAGAQAGAALGTMIFPGVGTAIGGAVGGIGGGALGYFGGEKIIDTIGTSISGAVEKSGLGDHIGRGVSLIMSPFSEDAREALKSDWKNNIAPSLTKAFTPLQDTLGKWGDKLMGLSSMFSAGFDKVKDLFGPTMQKGLDIALSPVRALGQAVAPTVGKGLRAIGVDPGKAAGVASSILPSSLAQSLGFVAAKYESGGRGVATISTGKGDHGGVSYGKHQLATNNGSMAKFLASAQGKAYGAQFAGLTPGTAAFNEKYKQIVGSDGAGMEKAQQEYIVATHYNPLASKVARETGVDVNKRGRGVQEAIMSTSIQYGGATSAVTEALKGKDAASMSDEEIINALQDYKARTVNTRFKSSSQQTRDSVARRIERERADLLAVTAADKAGKGLPGQEEKPVVASAAKAKDGTVTHSSTATPAATGDKKVVAVAAAPVEAKPTTTVATATPAASVMGSAENRGVSGRAQGYEKVPNNAPDVPKTVAVSNLPPPPPAPEKPKPAVGAIASAAARPSTAVAIDDIPIFFPDLSMVGIMTGRA